MQIPPTVELRPWVRHFLIYYPSDPPRPMRFFSDGCAGIVVPLQNSLLPYSTEQTGKHGEMMAYGIFDHYIDIAAAPDTGIIVTVLQPYALSILTGIPTADLKNQILPLKALFPSAASFLEGKIRTLEGIHSILSELEDFISGCASRCPGTDLVVTKSLEIILAHRGDITIPKLLHHLPVSERQLERKFKQYIGVPPKKFSGLQRMTHFLRLLRNSGSDNSPLKCALEAGYYDQAHLNNQFKSLTGTTPLSYLNAADPVAMNLFAR